MMFRDFVELVFGRKSERATISYLEGMMEVWKIANGVTSNGTCRLCIANLESRIEEIKEKQLSIYELSEEEIKKAISLYISLSTKKNVKVSDIVYKVKQDYHIEERGKGVKHDYVNETVKVYKIYGCKAIVDENKK